MKPILVEIPNSIETERLILRVPQLSGDESVVNEAIRNSIQELSMWLPFAQNIPSVEVTKDNLKESHMKFLNRESFRFLIFNKETQEYIGTASLLNIAWDIPKCEIGYWINTKFSGKGYMTEAIKELIVFGMEQLGCKRIEIRCESTNLKSRSIPEKLGFKLEGILRNEDLSADGKRLTDTCVYGLTDRDVFS